MACSRIPIREPIQVVVAVAREASLTSATFLRAATPEKIARGSKGYLPPTVGSVTIHTSTPVSVLDAVRHSAPRVARASEAACCVEAAASCGMAVVRPSSALVHIGA
eukprot:2423229-Rhodomonas_salina.1